MAAQAYAQNVKVDWDRATDFTRYNTYKWTKIPSPRTPTPGFEKLIYSVVRRTIGSQRPQEGRDRRTRSVRRLFDHARAAQETDRSGAGRRQFLMADREFLECA